MKMHEEQGPIRRAIPVGIGLIFLVTGFLLLGNAKGGYSEAMGYGLAGIACLLAGSILLAVPVSQFVSGAFGSLFYPDDKLRRAPPLYSRAEALAKMDHFDEAMSAYERIAEEYPGEVKPYVDMIEIAILHYRDPDRAAGIFQRGMGTLEKADDRDTLSRMYTGIRSRIGDKKDWQKSRTLRLD